MTSNDWLPSLIKRSIGVTILVTFFLISSSLLALPSLKNNNQPLSKPSNNLKQQVGADKNSTANHSVADKDSMNKDSDTTDKDYLIKMSVSLGPGYLWFSKKRPLKNTAIKNISVSYWFNKRWASMLLFGFFDRKSNAPSVQYRRTGYLFNNDILYYFRYQKPLQPYILWGLGVMNLPDVADNYPSTLVHANGGVGVQYFFDPKATVYANLTYMYVFNSNQPVIMANVGLRLFFNLFHKLVANTQAKTANADALLASLGIKPSS